jgi:malate/lactate dehydrogenase
VGKLIQLLRRAVRFEKLRADVKVFDASKVVVQSVEDLEDDFVVFGVTTLDVVCANTFVA